MKVIICYNPLRCVNLNCERSTSIKYQFLHESLNAEWMHDLEIMKAMIDWFSHLAKQPYLVHEWLNPCTHFEPEYDWINSWTLSLIEIIISIDLSLGYRRALWFKTNLSQIWGSVFGWFWLQEWKQQPQKTIYSSSNHKLLKEKIKNK